MPPPPPPPSTLPPLEVFAFSILDILLISWIHTIYVHQVVVSSLCTHTVTLVLVYFGVRLHSSSLGLLLPPCELPLHYVLFLFNIYYNFIQSA